MSKNKNNKGLLPFLVGMVAGAAAVFFSKEENREKTKQALDETAKKAKKVKEDVEKNPEKVKKQAKKKVEEVVKQARGRVAQVVKPKKEVAKPQEEVEEK